MIDSNKPNNLHNMIRLAALEKNHQLFNVHDKSEDPISFMRLSYFSENE